MAFRFWLVCAGAALLATTACSSDDVDAPNEVCPAFLAITPDPLPTLRVGDSVRVMLSPECAGSQAHWSTRQSAVAVVRPDLSASPFVIGVAPGGTVLDAALETDAQARDAVVVSVQAK